MCPALGMLLAVVCGTTPVQAQTIRADMWITNGTVNATAVSGDSLYLGGSFTAVGPSTGSGIPLDNTTGLALAGFPEINGPVNAVVPDGSGGWYIGGQFSAVGAAPRSNLAHILPDLSVGPWSPGTNGIVRALLLTGSSLIAGGDFTTAGGQNRSQIAEIDLGTGLATAWNPNADLSVRALATDGSVIYAGGDFTSIGGQTRMRIAALDPVSGLASAWDPGPTGSVRALAVSGGLVYAGGLFSNIGGQNRNRLAALSTTTGVPTGWDPNVNGQVLALAVDGGTVYAGGLFTGVGTGLGAALRSRLAALDVTTGLATAWNPSANNQVLAISVRAGTVYVGGDFTIAGGQVRNRIAAIDAALGAATPWDPNAFSTVAAIATSGSVVYAGGSFNGMGGVARGNLAALSVASGAPLAWAPNPNGQVFALALGGGSVYVGGSFTSIGAAGRTNLAAISPVTGAATSWAPDPDGAVQAILARGNTVYAAGAFANAGGQPRNDLVALDASSGLATAWNPNVAGSVFALALEEHTIHVGGAFSSVGVQSRNNLAEVDLGTGLVTPWNPDANGTVRSLAIDCGTVYVGGFFTTIGGQTRNRVAEVDPTTGVVLPWNPNANGPVFSLGLGQGSIYVGGVFSVIGGPVRNRVASIDLSTGLATAWDPNANNVVRSMTVANGAVYLGGSFTLLGIQSQANVAQVSADASVTCAPVTVSPATLPAGHAGDPYSRTFTATGGPSPFCFAVTAGAIPAGMTLAGETGVLSGTPGALGTYVFTVTATSSIGCTGSRPETLIVLPACAAMIAVNPDTLAHGRVGVPYAGALSASAGIAPHVYALTAGSLPAGISLSAAGVFSGTPTVAGTSSFTAGVTDAIGCTGSRGYSIVVEPPCVAVPITPPFIADGVVGVGYHVQLAAGTGTAPYAWTLSSGSLPAGLTLGAATGALDGTPLADGTFSFEVAVSEAGGCGGTQAYTMSVFAAEPATRVAARTAGRCITPAQPCTGVPITLARGETTPARAISVTFHLDTSRITLCAPGSPASSIHPGTWLDGLGSTYFQVLDDGGGSYTVDQALLGGSCGPVGGGTLFTLDLKSVIPGDGAGTITVDVVHLRDCEGAAIPAGAGAPSELAIDRSGPAPITDLATSQVLAGNGSASTTGIAVTWSTGLPAADLYRAPFGGYPLYSHAGPITPPDPVLAPGGPWTLAAANVTSGAVDHPPTRGFWMYVAISRDSCGVPVTGNRSAGSLDYHLGDVSDEWVRGQGDDLVGTADVSLLGAHYGIADPAIGVAGVAYLDVGPTTDSAPTSRPVPDGVIDFEDLMMFSTNYGAVSAPNARLAPARLTRAVATAGDGVERFALDAPALVSPGAEVSAVIRLSAGGGMQGFSARLAWDAAVVTPVSWDAGGLVGSQGGIVLSPRPGTIDAARLGAGGGGMGGDGEVATVRFRVLREGDAAIRLAGVDARDAANHRIDPGMVRLDSRLAPPAETVLLAPQPNPVRGAASLSFTLAAASAVELSVYSVDGRQVRSLVHGARAAGVHHVEWDGRDEARHPVSSGVYYVHLSAGSRRFTRTLVVIK